MAKRKLGETEPPDARGRVGGAGGGPGEAGGGAKFEWHYGRVTRLGHYEIAGGRGISIMWEEGGVTSQHGDICEEVWEIATLAFMTTGRIAVLSDQRAEGWMYDYRFFEAVR